MKDDLKKEDTAISVRLSDIDTCRICQIDDALNAELVSPCLCSGSVRWVHEECLNRWIFVSKKTQCEICGYSFSLKKKTGCHFLPLLSWEKGNLLRSVGSVLVALVLLIGSLYAVAESSMGNFGKAKFGRQFWTNIILETIGCFGIAALLYICGRYYFKLILRFIEYNRKLVIDTSSLPRKNQVISSDEVSTLAKPENVEPTIPVGSRVSPSFLGDADPSNDATLEIEFGKEVDVFFSNVALIVDECD